MDVPVPPFNLERVPASVIAPVVDVLGVNPVVPALNEVTPRLLIVMVPTPLVIPTPVPAVRVFDV